MGSKKIDSNDIQFMNNLLRPEGFYSFVKLSGGKIKNRYYKLSEILGRYMDICNSIKGELVLDINKFLYDFVYTYKIYDDPENFIFTAFYRILWNVEKISDIVKKYNIQIEEFYISDLHRVMTGNVLRNIKKDYLSTAEKNNEPICIIKFEPYNDLKNRIDLPQEYRDFLIIDGNHRLHAKFIKNETSKFRFLNKKSEKIKAYVLDNKFHMELICNDRIALIYKINANINFLREYTIGSINQMELEEKLYEI
ncbi:hypothetical protein [Clostridium tunisiense]|uniref:hypothetical protein n=1 Tax=Clostridium tunisiense TaxID=219748 RepID=UPI00031F59DB|nr:hypothetical protein [Clostridium tunisiense]